MARTEAADTRKIAFTTSSIEENFETSCKGVVLSADADCFVDFDRPADTGSLLVKANLGPVHIPVQFTRLTVVGGGSGNLYVVGLR